MKIKLICAAAAAVIAVSSAVVATAYGNSASDNEAAGTAAKASSDIQEAEDVELTAKDEKTSENEEENIAPVSDEDAFDENTSVGDKAPEITESSGNTSFKAVNAINSEITYSGELGENIMDIRWFDDSEPYYRVDDSNASLGYFKKYFNSDIFPIDEKYKDNLVCNFHSGTLKFDVSKGTQAISPVGGKVIGVSNNNQFNGGWGNAVAVEFDNKIFIMTHLDSVSVKTGDEITAGQVVGVCGNSGMVMYDKAELGLTLMEKH